jgi:hypothetical protein
MNSTTSKRSIPGRPAQSPNIWVHPSSSFGSITKAFLQMKKFDIAALERAYAGTP